MAEIKAPPSINLPALRPIEPNSVPEMTDKPTNGSSNGSLVTRKIKACPELPPGKRFYLPKYCLLHFVAFFHVGSLLSTNKKALDLTNSSIFHSGRR